MSWLWDAFQQRQIGEAKEQSSQAALDARLTRHLIRDLEDKVDRLSLLCHALFEELEETTGFSETRLKERMVEIDLRDGKLDGKYEPTASSTCPDCRRKTNTKRPNCLWCGVSLTAS